MRFYFPLDHLAWMVTKGEPFEDVLTAFADFQQRPDADEYRVGLEHERVVLYCTYKRPVEDCAAVVDNYLQLQTDPLLRGDAVSLACSRVPELRERYIPPMLTDLEALPASKHRDALLKRLRELRDAGHP